MCPMPIKAVVIGPNHVIWVGVSDTMRAYAFQNSGITSEVLRKLRHVVVGWVVDRTDLTDAYRSVVDVLQFLPTHKGVLSVYHSILSSFCFVPLTGFEPMAFPLGEGRSILLSYRGGWSRSSY